MIRIFKTTDSGIRKVAVAEEGCWIALTNPTAEELSTTADQFNIDVDDLKSPLDEEERSRIQVEENYTLIILDIPTIEERKGREYFYTIPFGIIFTDKYIFTVCLVDSPVLTVFMDGRVRDFYTFTTSLRGNEVVLEKLMRNTSIPRYEDDEELLEDVIIENKQAIEMAKIYSDILSGTMDAFASVISNNLNIAMKFLSVITIVLTVPTIVTSALGMNVAGIPFANNPYGFWIVVGISLLLTLIAGAIIAKNKHFK